MVPPNGPRVLRRMATHPAEYGGVPPIPPLVLLAFLIRQHLALVQYPIRVELPLDGAHQIHGHGIQFPADIVTLDQANAMLAGQGAAQAQHQVEHFA